MIIRFFRWLFTWKNFRRFLFIVACLGTLLALAVAEENWRGRRAWQNHRREWEAKGEKFDLRELIPAPVPEDKNFALTPLFKPILELTNGPAGAVWRDTNAMARLSAISAQIPMPHGTNNDLALGSVEKGTFADLAACQRFYRGNTNYPQAASTTTPAEVILIALAKFEPEIKELREAAVTRPFARFPIQYDYQPSWEILLPHLAHLKGLTMLFHVRAVAELESGRPAEALADLKVGFKLSDSIRGEPLLIDHLVRLAATAINLQTVREGLVRHAWTEAELSELETYLGSLDLLAEYLLAMRGERALAVGGLDYLRHKGSRAPMFYLGNEEGASAAAGNFNLMPSGWLFQNMLTISRLHQAYCLAAVDERAHRAFPQMSESGTRVVTNLHAGPYTIFAKLLLPALEKAIHKSARMQTCVDAAQVACALERCRLANGNLPENLEALAPRFIARIPNDVIDGKPLRYRREANGSYLIYSIGWNETDDGGVLAWKKNSQARSSDPLHGDWVWAMP